MSQYIVIKVVALPQGQSAEFYLNLLGYWTQNKDRACVYSKEELVDDIVNHLNKKADKHYCNDMLNRYQITTYLKEEI